MGYWDKDMTLRLRILHQSGLTNAEIAEKMCITEHSVEDKLIQLGKHPNTKATPQPSEYKVHVHIPQGKVVRADKPVDELTLEQLGKLPY